MEGLLPVATVDKRGLMTASQVRNVGYEIYAGTNYIFKVSSARTDNYTSFLCELLLYANSMSGQYNEISVVYGTSTGEYNGKVYKLNNNMLPKFYHDSEGSLYIKFTANHYFLVRTYSSTVIEKVDLDLSGLKEIIPEQK